MGIRVSHNPFITAIARYYAGLVQGDFILLKSLVAPCQFIYFPFFV